MQDFTLLLAGLDVLEEVIESLNLKRTRAVCLQRSPWSSKWFG